MPSKDEREMLIEAVREALGVVIIPEHAMRKLELLDLLKERGYRFTEHQFRETLTKMVREGKVKKQVSGRQTYYWFVEETTQ